MSANGGVGRRGGGRPGVPLALSIQQDGPPVEMPYYYVAAVDTISPSGSPFEARCRSGSWAPASPSGSAPKGDVFARPPLNLPRCINRGSGSDVAAVVIEGVAI